MTFFRPSAVGIFAIAVTTASLSPGPATVDRVADKVALAARPFPLQDVRLLDGPFKQAMQLDQQYLLSLDPDRLLHNFRVNAGLPSSASPHGRWEPLVVARMEVYRMARVSTARLAKLSRIWHLPAG